MSDREPTRLIEDDGEDAALRLDLTRASDNRVDYDVAAGVAAFETSLAGAPPPGLEASVTPSAAGLTGGKVMLIVVGLAAAVGVGVVGLGGDTDEPAPVVAQQAAPSESADSRPALVPEPKPEIAEPRVPEPPTPAVATPQPDLDDGPVPKPELAPKTKPVRRRPGKTKPSPSEQPAPAVDQLEAEMAATNKARRALAGNPSRALQLAREADRTFAGGLFSEQRAGIATLALFALGKDAEATKAAERYLRKYPKGTYADKVRSRRGE